MTRHMHRPITIAALAACLAMPAGADPAAPLAGLAPAWTDLAPPVPPAPIVTGDIPERAAGRAVVSSPSWLPRLPEGLSFGVSGMGDGLPALVLSGERGPRLSASGGYAPSRGRLEARISLEFRF